MFWNIENFFDWKDGGNGSSDKEFSSSGSRHWTAKKFYCKCNLFAKTLFWVKDQMGDFPYVIGLAEVENRFAVQSLITSSNLHKTSYKVVHFDSPDPRGIDVALLYRSDRLRKISAKPCHILDSSGRIVPTRDILCALFEVIGSGKQVCFMINHHPSKYSGASSSQRGRDRAMLRMKFLVDSLRNAGFERIFCMGDFNDSPKGEAFYLLDSSMVNLALTPRQKGEGTIRYDGRWELIDMFIIPINEARNFHQKILYPPFLMVPDRKNGGLKPLRTYSGPRYMGGVSDHLPILMLPCSVRDSL